MIASKKNKKNRIITLETIQHQIISKQFTAAINNLESYIEFKDKLPEAKKLIVENFDQVLGLANLIFSHAESSLKEKKQSGELCQVIHFAWVIVYEKKLQEQPLSISAERWNTTVNAVNFYATETRRLSAQQIVEEIIANAANQAEKKENEKKENKQLATSFLKKADTSFKEKDFLSASHHYESYLERDINNPEAYFNLARCYKELGVKCQKQNRCSMRLASPGSVNFAKLMIDFTSEEISYYGKALHAYEIGMSLLEGSSQDAMIYREIGHLRDLRGEYSLGVENYKKACEIEKNSFNAFYAGLIDDGQNKRLLEVAFRYACIFLDKEFIQHFNRISPDNEHRFYARCGGLYMQFLEASSEPLDDEGRLLKKYIANAAIQYLLLAVHFTLDKAKKENIFNICLKKMEKHLDVSVFSNIFNLLEKERITEIKQAYIDWIVFYLNQGQYKHALKKFSLIEAIAKKPAQMSADFPGLEARITQLFHLKECANALNRFSKNDYEGAVERYKIVITKTPSNIEAHFGLAKCYRRLGENIKRDRRFDIVDASVEARVATGQLKELAVIMSDEEKDFYNKAEKYFNLGLELLNETFADPHIYSELACLKELRGNFSEAAEDRLEAVEGNQEMFYENYRQLATQEYDSKLFCVTLRFDFFMHDEAFAQYCVDRKFHENYMSGLHLDCGVIYECNDFFDLAMQQYLLALNLSKSIEQSTKILEILNLLFEYFSILKQDIPASVFQNIINITNAQELIMIKCAYVLWIKSDFDANKYQAAARKCVLIDQPTRPFFLNMPNKLAVLRTADFFFEMGDEYSRLNKSDLAVCAYDKCLELNASYPEAGAKREYLLAAAQKPADVYVQKSSPALFAQSSPIDENAGCKVAELAL